MNCHESLKILYRFIDEDLDGLTIEEIQIHLKRCRPCWGRYEFESKLKEHLHKSCHHESPSESLLQRIKSLLEQY